MSVLSAIAFWLIALGQFAVLRDQTIPETPLFEGMRRVRITSWFVAGAYAWSHFGPWMLPIWGLAVSDAIYVMARLWPSRVDRS